jgi:hypothetical protein
VFILGKKIFSSRTSRPISILLGTNHPWVNWDSELFKLKGPVPFQRGDNKNGVGSFKDLLMNH